MKLKTLSFFLIVSLYSLCSAQTNINGRFVVKTNNGINYSVKIQISASTANNRLGSSNLRFSFNDAVSYPVNPIQDTDFTFQNFSGGNYEVGKIVRPASNEIGINIELDNINHGTLIAQYPDWTDVVTINFSLTNVDTTTELTWNSPACVFFADDESTLFNIQNFDDKETTPVELTSFTANMSDGKVIVNWQTATEINNSGFSVERSSDNISFKEIAFIRGHGTTTDKSVYSYADNSALSGKYYYRLKQVDYNGSFSYSSSIEVNIGIPKNFSLDQNYPNPFNPSTTIRFALPTNARVSIKLYNTLGQEVVNILNNEQMNAGVHETVLNASNFSSGVYFYRLEAEGDDGSVFAKTKRMVFIK
jgi:Secretion system C-terminal sorting domain